MSTYEISQSSLLSLKAEILRKQQELTKNKAENDVKIKQIKKKTPLELKNRGLESRLKNDMTEEEEDLLKKSKIMLDKKTKLYDKLLKHAGNISADPEDSNKYLVMFDKKSYNQPEIFDDSEENQVAGGDEDFTEDLYTTNLDDDDDWIDYVDCLGRTRTCLKTELDFFKSREKEYQRDTDVIKDVPREEPKIDIPVEIYVEDETKELLSGDMRREMSRQQWEKEEEELKQKNDVHYQDILFNEARTHGVGYYGFSKDEAERREQQDALKKLRIETEQKQKKSQDMKAIREAQLAARIKAAKNRKRARLGLPPETEEEEQASQPHIEEPKAKEVSSEDEIKAMMGQKLLEEARRNHVRPWDVGKEKSGEDFKYTQEEWVTMKRNERLSEFAPPTTGGRKEFRSQQPTFIANSDAPRSLHFTTKKRYMNNGEPNNIGAYNSYKSCTNVHKSGDHEVIPPKLVKIDDLAGCSETISKAKQNVGTLHVPMEAQYNHEKSESSNVHRIYGNVGYKYASKPPSLGAPTNIEESIEAGLKFLRKQTEIKLKDSENEDMFLS